MPWCLLWQIRDSKAQSRPSYRAPSWSWASVEGTAWHDLSEFGYLCDIEVPASIFWCDTELTADLAPYGQVSGGRLQMMTLVKEILDFSIIDDIIILSDPEFNFRKSAVMYAIDVEGRQCCKPGLGHTIVVCCIVKMPSLAEVMGPYKEWSEFRGLILREGRGQHYARIGLLSFSY